MRMHTMHSHSKYSSANGTIFKRNLLFLKVKFLLINFALNRLFEINHKWLDLII